MKHERAERILAVVLAAVLLAGCGRASSPEAASSLPRQEKKTHASMDAAGASTPATEPEVENVADYGFPEHEDPVFTQWEVHKTVVQQDGTRISMNMEVPQLNSSSPDAVAFNEEMTRLYVEPTSLMRPCRRQRNRGRGTGCAPSAGGGMIWQGPWAWS